jgi:hypothetical protein
VLAPLTSTVSVAIRLGTPPCGATELTVSEVDTPLAVSVKAQSRKMLTSSEGLFPIAIENEAVTLSALHTHNVM